MIYAAIIALGLFVLARGKGQGFWTAVVLSAIAQFALWPLHLDPVLSSVVLLALELKLLFDLRDDVRGTGDLRRALWLPALFVLWANLDIHFVYGLLVLILFLAAVTGETIAPRTGAGWVNHRSSGLSLTMWAAVIGGCFLAAMVSPYGYAVYDGASSVFGNRMLQPYLHELQALHFRRPQEFVLLLLAMAAFFLLGRSRWRDLFSWVLMLASAALSISLMSASWVVVVCSVAVIAHALPIHHPEPVREAASQKPRMPLLATAALITALVLLLVAIRIPGSQTLLARMSAAIPVKACDYIREHKLPEPLFNNYEWGGFVIWYLPDYPVAMDTRHEIYGEEANLRYFKITNGEMPLGAELHFAYAGSVIVPSNSPMAIGLAAGPRFTPVYRDDVALVLVRTALLKGQ
jgi:hypothetical protein